MRIVMTGRSGRRVLRHRASGGSGRHTVTVTTVGADCQIRVHNAGPLSGEVVVPGAKNSVLKLMAASLLADGVYEINNVPSIVDVGIMAELLRAIGLEVTLSDPGLVTIVNEGDLTPIAPLELVAQMRVDQRARPPADALRLRTRVDAGR
jgi:hypothetical protein